MLSCRPPVGAGEEGQAGRQAGNRIAQPRSSRLRQNKFTHLTPPPTYGCLRSLARLGGCRRNAQRAARSAKCGRSWPSPKPPACPRTSQRRSANTSGKPPTVLEHQHPHAARLRRHVGGRVAETCCFRVTNKRSDGTETFSVRRSWETSRKLFFFLLSSDFLSSFLFLSIFCSP